MRRKPVTLEEADAVVAEGRAILAARAGRADALIARLRSLQEHVAKNFWHIGHLLVSIRRERLYLVAGYRRFEDFLRTTLTFSRSVASKLMTIAASLPQHEAEQLGQERAYAVIAYARALPDRPDPAALVRADAPLVGGKPLSQTSVRVILAARPPRRKTLAERVAEAVDKGLARRFAERLKSLGGPRGAIVARGNTVVGTWTRRQIEHFVKRG